MSIVVDSLVKAYGANLVVNQVSFEVAERECFVLLGPSGSGKSTVLRIIAGLADADTGRVLLRGRDVNRLPPQRRGVGFVFQQYALFAHMTVAENIEFALRIRRSSSRERRRRRDELLELVGLVGLQDRYPHQLSGGQQQRVSLARALAHRPDVLLLDEPFGALDARIRLELRRTLRRIQRELQVTTLFVTHDQEEAFELADHMGVMNFGRLLEVGPPQDLYFRPQTEFVAAFLGKANLVVGRATPQGVQIGDAQFPVATESANQNRVQVLFRPEDVSVKESKDSLEWPPLGEAIVDEVEFSGSSERLRLRLPRAKGVRAIAPAVPFGSGHMLVEAVRPQYVARRFPLKPGDRAWVGIRRLHALAHPGLSFVLLDDGTDSAHSGVAFGAELARICHARVTVLVASDGRVQPVREALGSGLAALDIHPAPDGVLAELERFAARQSFDFLVTGRPPEGAVGACNRVWRAGGHHLVLSPRPGPIPRSALVCATAGESGKADVLLAGRLLRHLGALVTLLTVVPEGTEKDALDRVERFHAASVQTLSLLGVEVRPMIRQGRTLETIRGELRRGPHELLVVGAPSPADDRIASLHGVVASLVEEVSDLPMIIVRSEPSER